jgi:Fe2+ or Zn2+ uptake regulation protein
MWEAIKDILKKKACFHDWKLVKEEGWHFHKHYIYICQKCGKIKEIDIKY